MTDALAIGGWVVPLEGGKSGAAMSKEEWKEKDFA